MGSRRPTSTFSAMQSAQARATGASADETSVAPLLRMMKDFQAQVDALRDQVRSSNAHVAAIGAHLGVKAPQGPSSGCATPSGGHRPLSGRTSELLRLVRDRLPEERSPSLEDPPPLCDISSEAYDTA